VITYPTYDEMLAIFCSLYVDVISCLLQVSVDGAISFTPMAVQFTTEEFPIGQGRALIAVYWANVDTRGSGNVWYYDTTRTDLITRANEMIKKAFRNQPPFNATLIFVATWYQVGYFDQKTDRVSV